MADTSLKLRALVGGVPIERDPIALMAGLVSATPLVVPDGETKTVGQAVADTYTRAKGGGLARPTYLKLRESESVEDCRA